MAAKMQKISRRARAVWGPNLKTLEDLVMNGFHAIE
jgi:hypothetical protein